MRQGFSVFSQLLCKKQLPGSGHDDKLLKCFAQGLKEQGNSSCQPTYKRNCPIMSILN